MRFHFPPTKALRFIILVVVAILVPITFSGCGASPASGPLTPKVAAPVNSTEVPVVVSSPSTTGDSSVAATGGSAAAGSAESSPRAVPQRRPQSKPRFQRLTLHPCPQQRYRFCRHCFIGELLGGTAFSYSMVPAPLRPMLRRSRLSLVLSS